MTKLPALPSSLPSTLGPVPVKLVSSKALKDGRYGDFAPKWREIRIDQNLPLIVKWQVLYHEWTHLVLFDSGLHNTLDDANQEVLCDAFGQARAFELAVQCGVVTLAEAETAKTGAPRVKGSDHSKEDRASALQIEERADNREVQQEDGQAQQ